MTPARIIPFRRNRTQPSPPKGFFEQEEESMAKCWRAEWVSGLVLGAGAMALWAWTGALVFGLFGALACWQVWDSYNFWTRHRTLAESLRKLGKELGE